PGRSSTWRQRWSPWPAPMQASFCLPQSASSTSWRAPSSAGGKAALRSSVDPLLGHHPSGARPPWVRVSGHPGGGSSVRRPAGVPRPVTEPRQNGRVNAHPFDPVEPTLFDDPPPLDPPLLDHTRRHGAPEGGRPAELPPADSSPTTPPGWPEVEVRVSARRRKTSEARW